MSNSSGLKNVFEKLRLHNGLVQTVGGPDRRNKAAFSSGVLTVAAYHLAKKIRKFRLKVKRNSNFSENPFGNCRLPPEVFLLFRRNGTAEISLPFAKLSSFQSLICRKQLREIELQMVSAILFGQFADFGKTLTIIQRSSQSVYSDKWEAPSVAAYLNKPDYHRSLR